ncbi:mammalian cell entry protein [Nocardia neocaledoniensis]|uniref:mammalian cell entry protein n=1 Tax=Nocardia neocaledoniensis TaxID=236511 RepID=UPI002455E9C2|nr:mammalian cell entry protein [Nocardia neocaledoniensis]
MPAYTLPGTEVGPRRARLLGVLAVVVAVLGLAVWRVVPADRPADEIRVALLVGQVGAGVGPGTDVRLDGVHVGSVETIDFAGRGTQRIGLTLRGSQLFGLSDALSVDYAPGSLFGISAVELHPGAGGVALVEGATVDLTGRDAERVRDATLSALLTSTGALADQVLTPKLAELLGTVSRDLAAFAPLLAAIGATVRSFTETQLLPPSLLFDQFGSALTGLPPMLTGSLTLLYADYTNEYLSTPEHLEKFGRMFSDIQYQLLPTVTELLTTSRQHFGGLLPMASLVLDQLSGSVSTPERTGRQLGELLDRLDSAFVDTPQGPVLRAAVDLDGVPGLAAPLAAVLGQGGR